MFVECKQFKTQSSFGDLKVLKKVSFGLMTTNSVFETQLNKMLDLKAPSNIIFANETIFSSPITPH